MKWYVDVFESESGWGKKLDDTKEFDSQAAATEFQSEFNAKNTAKTVPSWYMYAGNPYQSSTL